MSRPAFLQDIQRIGFVGWLAYAIDRSVSSISAGRVRFTALWLYAQPVASIPDLNARTGDRIQIRTVAQGDVPEVAFRRPAGAVAERFAQGSVCIAALKDAELAGFMWLQFDRLPERLVRCDFVPLPHGKACWDFDFFVAPAYRLGRTFGRLWSHAKAYLDERGIETTLSWIAFENVVSQRSHERMGARRVGWVIVLTVAKLQVLLASTRPYFSLSASSAHRTKILVDAGRRGVRP